jgi:hypothetical protein
MPGFDVFNQNAFSMQSLMARLLDVPFVPGQVGSLGIFDSRGMFTTDLSVEKQGATLALVQTSPRNAQVPQNVKDARTLIKIPTARIALEDTITADEVQNVRALFSESDVDTIQAEVDRRVLRMSRSIDATLEFQRMGALKGLVLDADGSTLVDLFATFGVSQQSEVAFDLGNTNSSFRGKCSGVIRTIAAALDGVPFKGVHAFCSAQFFDDILANVEFRATYLNYAAAATLRGRGAYTFQTVDFGGITFEEYRGQVGSTKFIADDKVVVFPVGVPELFITSYAPAEYWDTVNTLGSPRYVRINPDGIDPQYKRTIRVQCQPVPICTRPRVLVPGKRGA